MLLPCYELGGLEAKVYPHWEADTFAILCLGEEGICDVRVIERRRGELLMDIIDGEGVRAAFTLSISTRALELLERRGVVLTGAFSAVRGLWRSGLRVSCTWRSSSG